MMGKDVEIRIDKVTVFDPKLEGAVRKTAKSAAESAAKGSFDVAYVIKLTPTLSYDDKAREIVAVCGWKIYEGGGSMLFERLKQTKQSTGRATALKDKVSQGNLDDTIGAVTDKEVSAIVKSLKAMPPPKPGK
jgi:hypothetical protein